MDQQDVVNAMMADYPDCPRCKSLRADLAECQRQNEEMRATDMAMTNAVQTMEAELERVREIAKTALNGPVRNPGDPLAVHLVDALRRIQGGEKDG